LFTFKTQFYQQFTMLPKFSTAKIDATFSGDYLTWKTKELPMLRNLASTFTDAQGSYFHYIFPDEPGDPRVLSPDPGTLPTWDDMGAYDAMDPDEKKLALSELNSRLALWNAQNAHFTHDNLVFRQFKNFLDEFLSKTWRDALFPENEDHYSDAECQDVINAIEAHFLVTRTDPNTESTAIRRKLEVMEFRYSDSLSWRIFYADFFKLLRSLSQFGIEPISDHIAANYLIEALERCPDLMNLPEFSISLFQYRRANSAADTRTPTAVASLVHQVLDILARKSTASTGGYANSATTAAPQDPNPDPDSDDASNPAFAASSTHKKVPAAPTRSRTSKPPSRKPNTVKAATSPAGQTTITITTSDPAMWQPLVQNFTAAQSTTQFSRPNPRTQPPNNVARAYAATTGNSIKPNYPRMYCYSCGTTTGPSRHFSQDCPPNLRLPTHDTSCNFRNWEQFPGATQP
jgi:hypothetical protein